jgi:hypothetical protein
MKKIQYKFTGFCSKGSWYCSFQLQHQRIAKHEPHIQVQMCTAILSHVQFNSSRTDIQK